MLDQYKNWYQQEDIKLLQTGIYRGILQFQCYHWHYFDKDNISIGMPCHGGPPSLELVVAGAVIWGSGNTKW